MDYDVKMAIMFAITILLLIIVIVQHDRMNRLEGADMMYAYFISDSMRQMRETSEELGECRTELKGCMNGTKPEFTVCGWISNNFTRPNYMPYRGENMPFLLKNFTIPWDMPLGGSLGTINLTGCGDPMMDPRSPCM